MGPSVLVRFILNKYHPHTVAMRDVASDVVVVLIIAYDIGSHRSLEHIKFHSLLIHDEKFFLPGAVLLRDERRLETGANEEFPGAF